MSKKLSFEDDFSNFLMDKGQPLKINGKVYTVKVGAEASVEAMFEDAKMSQIYNSIKESDNVEAIEKIKEVLDHIYKNMEILVSKEFVEDIKAFDMSFRDLRRLSSMIVEMTKGASMEEAYQIMQESYETEEKN